MNILSHPVTIYLLSISVVTLVMFAADKLAARSSWRRVPERTLLKLCLAGGSFGGAVGMMLFRHKISKPSFLKRYFAVVSLQVILIALWLYVGRNMSLPIFTESTGGTTVVQPSKSYRPVYE